MLTFGRDAFASSVPTIPRSAFSANPSLVRVAGRCRCPSVLRRYLAEHKLQLGWSEGLLFGRTAERPFDDSSLYARAATAWKHMNATRLANELEPIAPISLHEARHTYARLLIAAGVNAKSGTTYMGHASIQIFFDRYGHLMPGNEDEAAGLLDTYLDRVGQAWASEGQ
jgi:integrase